MINKFVCIKNGLKGDNNRLIYLKVNSIYFVYMLEWGLGEYGIYYSLDNKHFGCVNGDSWHNGETFINTFIPLAEYREQRINKILND